MPASILQQAVFSDTGGSQFGTTKTCTFPGPLTAGSTLVLFTLIGYTSPGTTISVSDTVNGAWPASLVNIDDTSDSFAGGLAYIPHVLAGSPTITVTWTVTGQNKMGGCLEVAGVTTTPLDGSNGQFQVSPPAGAGGVTPGAVTNTTQPVIVLGFSGNTDTFVPPTVDAGFTDLGTLCGTAIGSNCARWEWIRSVLTNSTGATFTAGDPGHPHLTMSLKLNEISAPSGFGLSVAGIHYVTP